MRLLLFAALAACGQKAKPAPPPAELEVAGPASIAGEWVADDEMSWSYALSIKADGSLVGRIDRGKLPRCEREGTLSGTGKQLQLAMTKNTCEQAHAHAGAGQLEVASFTGGTLTVVVTVDGKPERRTYTRRAN